MGKIVCNLRSHFADSTIHVADVKMQVLDEHVEYDVLRHQTLSWVAGL
jgi:hypothetical protein